MTAPRIVYVKVDRESHNEVYVSCVDENNEITEDSVHKTVAAAEKRAEKIAKQAGCEWGGNY